MPPIVATMNMIFLNIKSFFYKIPMPYQSFKILFNYTIFARYPSCWQLIKDEMPSVIHPDKSCVKIFPNL